MYIVFRAVWVFAFWLLRFLGDGAAWGPLMLNILLGIQINTQIWFRWRYLRLFVQNVEAFIHESQNSLVVNTWCVHTMPNARISASLLNMLNLLNQYFLPFFYFIAKFLLPWRWLLFDPKVIAIKLLLVVYLLNDTRCLRILNSLPNPRPLKIQRLVFSRGLYSLILTCGNNFFLWIWADQEVSRLLFFSFSALHYVALRRTAFWGGHILTIKNLTLKEHLINIVKGLFLSLHSHLVFSILAIL